MMEFQWVLHYDLHLPMFFFVIMKKFGFKIVLFEFKPVIYRGYVKGTFAQNITAKNFEII